MTHFSHKLRLLALLLACSLAAFFLRGAVGFTDPNYEELYYAQLARAESWKAQQHRTFLAYRFQRHQARRWKRVVLTSPVVSEAINLTCVTYPSAGCGTLWRRARCESGLNPYDEHPSSHASGLFQFLPSTWRTTPYRNFSIWSAAANSLAAGWMMGPAGRGGEWSCR